MVKRLIVFENLEHKIRLLLKHVCLDFKFGQSVKVRHWQSFGIFERRFKAFKAVYPGSVRIYFCVLLRCSLLEEHRVGPVSFALKHLDLQKAHVFADEFFCDFSFGVDALLVQHLMLGEIELLAETQHASCAVLVVAGVV